MRSIYGLLLAVLQPLGCCVIRIPESTTRIIPEKRDVQWLGNQGRYIASGNCEDGLQSYNKVVMSLNQICAGRGNQIPKFDGPKLFVSSFCELDNTYSTDTLFTCEKNSTKGKKVGPTNPGLFD